MTANLIDLGTPEGFSGLPLTGSGAASAAFSFDAGSAQAAASGRIAMIGVNEAGGDFGTNVPGVLGVDYTYPTDAEINYEISRGMNTIRIPFLAERIAANSSGVLSQTLLAPFNAIVSYATSQGLTVILDDHDYGKYFGQTLGLGTAADGQFATFWANLAKYFAGNKHVVFGLNNEPHYQTPLQWESAAQKAVTAIRAAGATQPILVSGAYYDSASNWYEEANGNSANTNAAALLLLKDPKNNLIYDVHNYLDPNNTGTGPATSTTLGASRLHAVTAWALSNHVKLFLSETGSTTDTLSLTALDNELNYVAANPTAWIGVTEWAAGPWWGNYNYSLEPTTEVVNGVTSYVDKPQMAQLETFAPHYAGSPWT